MVWQQWRAVQVEAAERARVQSAWILTGALDWARLILREDARSRPADRLDEPWAVPLAEARLSTFLAADKDNTDDAPEAFLSGSDRRRAGALQPAPTWSTATARSSAGRTGGAASACARRVGVSTDVADAHRRRPARRAARRPAPGGSAPLLPRTRRAARPGWASTPAPMRALAALRRPAAGAHAGEREHRLARGAGRRSSRAWTWRPPSAWCRCASARRSRRSAAVETQVPGLAPLTTRSSSR